MSRTTGSLLASTQKKDFDGRPVRRPPPPRWASSWSGLFVLIPVDFDEAGSAILVLVVDHEASVIG